MSFSVEGDYFEVCNCDVSCNCVWLGPATQDNCDVMLAWHVTKGSKDGVDLSGLNAVMVVHSPKRMTDGGWRRRRSHSRSRTAHCTPRSQVLSR